MNESFLNIIFLIVAAAVGYGVGLLDRRVTANVKQKMQDKEEALAAEKAAAKLLAEESRLEQVAHQLDEREKKLSEREQSHQALIATTEAQANARQAALRVSTDSGMNWMLELDGQRVTPGQLSAEQRQRLVGIIVQIRPWIDGKPAPPSAPPVEPPAQPAPVAAEVRPMPQPAAANVPSAPRINPLRGFRSMIENEVKKKEVAPTFSIIAMIDAILQKKLQGSPLAAKGISMEDGPMGEVLVHVGAVQYTGIDNVPDPQIQALIREAIADFNQGR